MPKPKSSHPTVDQLTAYAHGDVATPKFETIAQHLETCLECLNRAVKVQPDDFAHKLKSARRNADATHPWLRDFAKPNAGAPLRTCEIPSELLQSNKFRVLRELGRGGMGVVYLATHRFLGTDVAVKVIRKDLFEHSSAVQRFLQEVKVAAKLNHSNIVKVHDADQIGDLHLLVMEFVDGPTLSEILQTKGPFPIAIACNYARQAALGLQHAFEQGMVHRDIKPQNLMLTQLGEVKLLDFGLARPKRESSSTKGLTQVGSYMGTAEFIAPEQAFDASQADIRSDIYSLGCTLYTFLVGAPPFNGDTLGDVILAHVQQPAPPLSTFRSDLPGPLCAVIAKMIEKQPGKRYQSPIEVASELLPFCACDSSESTTVLQSQSQLTNPIASSRLLAPGGRLYFVIGAFFSVLLVTCLAFWLNGPRKPDGSLPKTFMNKLGMTFALAPKGCALLGGGGGRPGKVKVEICRDFYIGVFEVTQEEWQNVMGENPSHFSRTGQMKEAVKDIPEAELRRFPVDFVSWDDCQLFVIKLNDQLKENGWVYRLPTVVEWEYACRGGPLPKDKDFCFDYYFDKPTNTLLPNMANTAASGLKRPCKVGSYRPNRLGLYDMHGNAWEWCQDTFLHPKYGSMRVSPGGGWIVGTTLNTASNRGQFSPSHRLKSHGLRLVRAPG